MKKFWTGFHSLMVAIILFSNISSAASVVYATETESKPTIAAEQKNETKASESKNDVERSESSGTQTSSTAETETTQSSEITESTGIKESSGKVQELIQAISKLSSANVTYQDKGYVEYLIKSYNELSDEDKLQVTNINELNQVVQQINQLGKNKAKVQQQSEKKKITVTIERLVLGQGFIVEPMELEVESSWNYAQVIDHVLKNEGYQYEYTGNVNDSFYLAGIEDGDNGQLAIPNCVKEFGQQIEEPVDQLTYEDNSQRPALSEFSYTSTSGWKYSVNNVFPGVGMSDKVPQSGDVYRLQFTLLGLGADLGSGFGEGPVIAVANKDALIQKIGAINQDKAGWLEEYGDPAKAAYDQAMDTLKILDAPQTQVDQALQQLNEAEKEVDPDVEKVIEKIEAIGEVGLNSETKTRINAARTAYDALSGNQKGQISQEILNILLAAESKYQQLYDDDQVFQTEKMIKAIPALDQLTLDLKMYVDVARQMYDRLSEPLKARITNYQKLVDSEKRIGELEEEADPELAGIRKVIALIDSLPETITEKDKEAVQKAHKAYDELNSSQKTRVTNYSKLKKALEELANFDIMSKASLSINQASTYLSAKGISDEWTAFALAHIQNTLTTEQKMAAYRNIAAKVEKANGKFSPWTDAARHAIGIESLGGNASDVRGQNIPEAMINNLEGIKKASLNNPIFALITLNMRDYGVEGEKAAEDELVDFILSKQTSTGGWNLSGSPTGSNDVDMTGMAMTALSAHRDREDVQKATKKAIELLNSVLTKEGDFYIPGMFSKEGNSNSDAQALMGLALNGVDISKYPTAEEQTNPIHGLISYQLPSGAFMWQKSLPKENTMATQQSLYALVQFQMTQTSKGSSYNFDENPVTPLPEEDFSAEAARISQMIEALPAAENIRYPDNEAVAAVQAAYDELANAAKALIDPALVQKLADCQEKIKTDKSSANEVNRAIIKLLKEVPEASLEKREAIEQMYEQYQKLTDSQKEYLDQEKHAKFLEIYSDLQDLISDAEILPELNSKIEALPEPAEVALEDQAAITKCRELYESLSEKGKGQVTEEYLTKLKKCEKELAKFTVVKELIARIEALPAVITLKDKAEIEAIQKLYDSLEEDQQELITNIAKFDQAKKELKKLVLIDQLDQSVSKTIPYVEGIFSGEWQAFALAHLPNQLTEAQKLKEYGKIANAVEKANGNFSPWTDAGRYAIGVESLGGKASDVRGQNIPKAMINNLDAIKKGTLNNAIYALITLDMRDYGVEGEKAAQEELVNFILSKQTATGGWNLSGSTTGSNDVDMTGMAMTALSAHRDREDVRESTRNAILLLNSTLTKDGDFFIKSFFAPEGNSNSNAQALMGLMLNDVDIFSEAYISREEAHPITGLLSYQLPSGGFKWQRSDTKENSMATEQALYALAQIQLTLAGKGSSYDFDKNPVSPLPPEDFQAEADRVAEILAALPEPETVRYQDVETVTAAQKSFDGLAKQAQKLVDPALVDRLQKCQEKIEADRKKAKEVTSAITQLLKEVPKATLDKKKEITAVNEQYLNLSDSEKEYVDQKKVDALNQLVADLNVLIAEEAAYQSVVDEIEKLPEIEKISLADEEQVSSIREAYEALPEKNKERISEELLDKLTKSEERIQELKKAKATADVVNQQISKLPSVENVRFTHKKAVKAAEQAYEGLSDLEKTFVEESLLGKLQSLTKQIKKDQRAAKTIKILLGKLPTLEELKLSDAKKVATVRGAYDLLGEKVQEYVADKFKVQLLEYEKRICQLEKEEQAFKEVEALLNGLPAKNNITLDHLNQVKAARQAYDALSKEDQKKIAKDLLAKLTGAEEKISQLLNESGAAQKLATIMQNDTKNYVNGLFAANDPTFGTEWMVMDLARDDISSISKNYNKVYYANVVEYTQQKKGQLHKVKYTEFSRLTLAVTAIGKDARNIGGYNLFDYLSDFDKTVWQGVNGAIFALIAVDTNKDYQFTQPKGIKNHTTRKKLIEHILQKQRNFGGWNLTNNEEQTMSIDLTGMAIQALAPYYNDANYPAVHAAVDKALNFLSSKQNNYGAFGSKESQNVEEVAQVITGLTALGIDPATDARFKKNDKNLIHGLSQFHIANSGFMHVLPGGNSNGGGAGGELNPMASEQAFYALIAYKRFLAKENRLYDMNDLTLNAGKPVVPPTPKPEDKPDPNSDNGGNGDKDKNDDPKKDAPKPAGDQPAPVELSPLASAGESQFSELYGPAGGTPVSVGGGGSTPTKSASIKSSGNTAKKSSEAKKTAKKAAKGWDFAGESYEASPDKQKAKKDKKENVRTKTAVVITVGTAATAGLSGAAWWFLKRKV